MTGATVDELRAVKITPGYLPYAEGSVLIEDGRDASGLRGFGRGQGAAVFAQQWAGLDHG